MLNIKIFFFKNKVVIFVAFNSFRNIITCNSYFREVERFDLGAIHNGNIRYKYNINLMVMIISI